MKQSRFFLLALLLLTPWMAAAEAQDFQWHGYLDGRMVDAPDETSWTRGGLGKTRFGGGGTGLQFGGAALAGVAQLTPSLLAMADVQFQSTDRRSVDILDAYLRYRPVSLSRWRWSVQAGMFFPPISLENDAIGWTSPWTLTPSAINSWVGEELRVFGAQGRLEWRGDVNSWDLRTALFGRNEPAGNELATRGWSLSDLTYGLGSRLREPDALVSQAGGETPARYNPFQNIGNHVGWYGDLTWRMTGIGSVSLMRYDNRSDPSASVGYDEDSAVFAWHTYFWSLGATADTGPITWIAQGMDGSTVVEPEEDSYQKTRFRSAFLLAGWNRGAWRPALRIEHFSTRDPLSPTGLPEGEHGNAVTAALNWRPKSWLRFTTELLRIDSTRLQRTDVGLSPSSKVTQMQLGMRLLY